MMLEKNTPNANHVFAGNDYDHARDSQRLTSQYETIFNLVKDGKWRTLRDIERATGYPQASISAQLRHAKRPPFGSHKVEKEYLGNGLYQYRLIVNTEIQRKLF